MRTRSLYAVGAVALTLSTLAGSASAAIPRRQHYHEPTYHGTTLRKAPGHTVPTVVFTFVNNAVNEGERLGVHFAIVNAPTRAGVFLQRAEGTKHVWQNVARLGTANAHGDKLVPGVGIGEWTYRVAVELGKRTLAGSKWQHLYSYGTVSWAQWCNANNCSASTNTIQIGTSIFTYTVNDGWCTQSPDGPPGNDGNNCFYSYITNNNAAQAPGENTDLQVSRGTCSSITVSAAAASQDGNPGETGTIAVVRSDTDPQKLTLEPGQIETATFNLDNKPYYLEDWASAGASMAIFMNISFHCYTTTGDAPSS